MSRNLSTTSTLPARERESSIVQRANRAPSAISTQQQPDATDVVIPSNLLAAITSGPYSSNPNQFENKDASDTSNDFDVRQIAQQLQGETSRILARSTSVSIAGINRNNVRQDLPEFRKTSLEPNFDSSLRNRLNRQQSDPGRHGLSTVVEGKVITNEKRAPTNDYFGDFAFGTQGPRIPQRTSSDQSVSRKARIDEPSPTHPNPMRPVDRSLSHDININRISAERPRRSTAAGDRKESIVQQSAAIVLDTVENVKQAIRRSSIYDVYEKAKKRGAELQRSTWAMKLFEYTFYLILVAFVYFVLIGVPLWKGAVWWLYWVFEHKFAIAGTWYVIPSCGFALH